MSAHLFLNSPLFFIHENVHLPGIPAHDQIIYSGNIQDELTQLPIARICEIAIFGLLQITITKLSKQSPKKLEGIRKSIEQVRKQHNHNM